MHLPQSHSRRACRVVIVPGPVAAEPGFFVGNHSQPHPLLWLQIGHVGSLENFLTGKFLWLQFPVWQDQKKNRKSARKTYSESDSRKRSDRPLIVRPMAKRQLGRARSYFAKLKKLRSELIAPGTNGACIIKKPPAANFETGGVAELTAFDPH